MHELLGMIMPIQMMVIKRRSLPRWSGMDDMVICVAVSCSMRPEGPQRKFDLTDQAQQMMMGVIMYC